MSVTSLSFWSLSLLSSSQVLVSWGHHLVVFTGPDLGFWSTVYQWEHSNHGLPLHHLQCIPRHVYLHLPLCSAEKGKKMHDVWMKVWRSGWLFFTRGQKPLALKEPFAEYVLRPLATKLKPTLSNKSLNRRQHCRHSFLKLYKWDFLNFYELNKVDSTQKNNFFFQF